MRRHNFWYKIEVSSSRWLGSGLGAGLGPRFRFSVGRFGGCRSSNRYRIPTSSSNWTHFSTLERARITAGARFRGVAVATVSEIGLWCEKRLNQGLGLTLGLSLSLRLTLGRDRYVYQEKNTVQLSKKTWRPYRAQPRAQGRINGRVRYVYQETDPVQLSRKPWQPYRAQPQAQGRRASQVRYSYHEKESVQLSRNPWRFFPRSMDDSRPLSVRWRPNMGQAPLDSGTDEAFRKERFESSIHTACNTMLLKSH
ncbi:hypothetical protein PoB_000015900 [Plakobranchus ocellatus]|uniref:Uncharacterized protein n=1 Tax=Plakobranchus ocellatus TaxID=259542 RepID=A0AAV3XUL8_9GAST|nr:hypothetical protein PoB_000015900 [Plakobranchus ocellatus]